MRRYRAGNGGFTLLEMVVTLAIIGLLLTAAPAVMSTLRGGSTLRATAQGLADDLRAVRGAAVASGKEVSIVIHLAGPTLLTLPQGPGRAIPPHVMVGMDPAPTSDEDSDQRMIRFFADGSSTGGLISLSAEGRQRHVRIHWLTGRVSVED